MNKEQSSAKTDVIGIVSIIMAFVSLQIPGIILGLIGSSKAKKEGRSPLLSRIGWILNTVMLTLGVVIIAIFLLLIPSHHRQLDDLGRKADIRYYSGQLEQFYDSHGYYPPDLEQFKASHIEGDDLRAHPAVYTPSPENCTQCTSYVLKTTLNNRENGSTSFEIRSQHKN
jgi:hypothetical protein